ncbi:MAG: hypothetical protein ACK4F5_08995 [Aliihoeflea sp.]
MKSFARIAAALALSWAFIVPSVALSADLIRGVHVRDPGVCGHERVLNRIATRFDHQVRNVPNLPQVAIAGFHNIRENRHRPAMKDRPIDRRYCHAVVSLTNGHSRDVWYLIEVPMGFAGIGSNVEFCVSGFDRWYVYGGSCRILR